MALDTFSASVIERTGTAGERDDTTDARASGHDSLAAAGGPDVAVDVESVDAAATAAGECWDWVVLNDEESG